MPWSPLAARTTGDASACRQTLRLGPLLVLLAATAGLVACASKPFARPTKIEGYVAATADVNPDPSGRPSPVVVRIYELKSAEVFSSSDFFALYEKEAATLGADMLSKDEFELAPDTQRKFAVVAQPETRFVGVFAAYRDLDQARWRSSFAIAPNKTNTLAIQIGRQSVTITPQ
jgi:type VI secretion system protein VasD